MKAESTQSLVIRWRLQKRLVQKTAEAAKLAKDNLKELEAIMDCRAYDLCLPFEDERTSIINEEKSRLNDADNDVNVEAEISSVQAKWEAERLEAEKRRVEAEANRRKDLDRRMEILDKDPNPKPVSDMLSITFDNDGCKIERNDGQCVVEERHFDTEIDR